ncbi:MAG: hypothetical protein ACLFR2_09415 [Candidatus Kapaibacterium sp.]
MKKALSFIVCMFLLTAVYSQADPGIRVGMGVSLNTTAFGDNSDNILLPVGLANIRVPLQIGDHFRIEPEFGLYSMSEEYDYTINYGNMEQEYVETSELSITRLGGGFYYTMEHKAVENATLLFGLKSGMLFLSRSDEDETKIERTQNIFYIGGAIAGEYYFSEAFCLGLEVQVNHINYSEPEYEGGEISSEYNSFSRNLFTTNTVVFAKFFFN